MNAQQAQEWKDAAANCSEKWVLDPIHSQQNDLLLYQMHGNGKGQYAQFYQGVLKIGTFEHAVPHIGEAAFKVLGNKPFDKAEDAVAFLVVKGRIRLDSPSVRTLMKLGLL